MENYWLYVTIIAFLAVQFVQISVAAWRWNTHRTQSAEQLRERQSVLSRSSQIARLTSQLGNVQASPAAIPWRILEVADVVQDSIDCRSFYLVDPFGQPLPDFRPGQYVMVRPALAGAYQATRCYSISSSPDTRFWRITVKLQEVNADSIRANKGGLSAWLHRTIGKGDCLLIGGPSGQFYLPAESTRDIVLIAAGVGITPLASMLRWSLETTPKRNITLLYQAKNSEHWPLGRIIHQWQKDAKSLHAHTFFSRIQAEEMAALASELAGHFHSGKLDGRTAAKLAADPDADYYLCGPEAWMEQIRDQLLASGLSTTQIHWESFGSHAAPLDTERLECETHSIRFLDSDIETKWDDNDQTIWELAKANQIELPSGCLSGVCGNCRVKLISGQVRYDRQIGVELANGECLTCVGRPNTDLVLQA